jgi:hypothetical protein
MCDLEREIRLSLGRRICAIHPVAKISNTVTRYRERIACISPQVLVRAAGTKALLRFFYGNGGAKFSKSLNFFWSADFTDRGRCGYRGHRPRLRSGSAKPSYNFASIGVDS